MFNNPRQGSEISNFSQIASKWLLHNPVKPGAHTHIQTGGPGHTQTAIRLHFSEMDGRRK